MSDWERGKEAFIGSAKVEEIPTRTARTYEQTRLIFRGDTRAGPALSSD
jgi:hypothetical protein